MQHLGKRMGGIDQEFDVMLLAENGHGGCVHGSADGNAMMERHLLLARLRAVVERAASLLKRLYRLAPLGRATKN